MWKVEKLPARADAKTHRKDDWVIGLTVAVGDDGPSTMTKLTDDEARSLIDTLQAFVDGRR